MPDHEDSLGGETFSGEEQQDPAEQSLGDGATMGGDTAARSLGDQSTFGDANVDDELFDDGMELVDLSTRYTEEGVLGKGGMGEVILATDTRLNRKVAIKRIIGKSARSKTAVQRFLTEAQSMAELNHTNIVQIHDYGRSTDGPFLIMECVQGGSLLEKCKEGPIELDEAIDIFGQLCDGLGKAHAANIIHRDIKPANVLMTEDGIPKLTDFGLAKDDTADTGMTMEGAVIGTLDFMPPEQRQAAELTDHRSDLWSLAATFYQMLTGKNPKVINITSLPPKLQSVVAKALEESKEDRFQSAMEMREAILQAHSGKMDRSRTLGEGECPQCATPNPSHGKFCIECSAVLQVQCLECDVEIQIWNRACGDCGAQQTPLVEKSLANLKQIHDQAENLLANLEFEAAADKASTMTKETDARLQQYEEWREEFSQRLVDTRKSEHERLKELLEEAKTHEEKFDYEAARDSLSKVDKRLTDHVLENLGSAKSIGERITGDLRRVKDLSTANETVKKQAVSLLEEFEFNNAIEASTRIETEGHPDLKAYDAWVDEFGEEVQSKRNVAYKQLKEQLSQALEHEEQFDYEAGLESLTQVLTAMQQTTVSGRGDTAEELSERLTSKLSRLNELEGIVLERVGKGEITGLLTIVNELLTLKPDRPDVQKLKEQLEKRDADLLEARDAAVNKATQELDGQQYAEAVATLNTVPDEVFDAPVLELKTKASASLNQLNDLRDRITTAANGNQLKGLLPAVEECLALKADQDDLVKLKQDLIDHEAKMDARNQQIISQAQTHMQQLQFDEAIQILGTIAQEYHTSTTTGLSRQAKQLSVQRQGVLSAVSVDLSKKRYKATIKIISNYLGEIAVADIQDPELQQMLDEAKDKASAAIRKKKLVTLVSVAACVVVVLITGVVIKINLDAKALEIAIADGNWETVLELDSDNVEGLRMQAAAKAAAKAAAAILARAPITNTIGMKLKEIPAGTFVMGSPETEFVRGDDEQQHKVTITKAFYMQTTEVTQGQWKVVMGSEPWKGQKYSKYIKEGANYPAVYVNWDDAVAYCKKLSEKEGKTYRLATEAEWEYACRAGTESIWNFGNDEKVLGDYAWYDKNTNDIGEDYAHQVGLKKPNAFGLYDMHGNVREWCHDYYEVDYYKQSPAQDPTGPVTGSSRVLRGGSWFRNSVFSRSDDRNRYDAGRFYFSLGFRVVRELD
jgi:formylglycine-generating enzyme